MLYQICVYLFSINELYSEEKVSIKRLLSEKTKVLKDLLFTIYKVKSEKVTKLQTT